jgi:hypothetical protein
MSLVNRLSTQNDKAMCLIDYSRQLTACPAVLPDAAVQGRRYGLAAPTAMVSAF